MKKIITAVLISFLGVIFVEADQKKEGISFSTIESLKNDLAAHPENIGLRCALIKRLVEGSNVYDDAEEANVYYDPMISEEVISLIKDGCVIGHDQVIDTLIQNGTYEKINSKQNFTESAVEDLFQIFFTSARLRWKTSSFPKFGFSISVPGNYYVGNPKTDFGEGSNEIDHRKCEWIASFEDVSFLGGEPGGDVPPSIVICSPAAGDAHFSELELLEGTKPITTRVKIGKQNARYLTWHYPGIEFERVFNSRIEITTDKNPIFISFSYTLPGYGAIENIENYQTKSSEEQTVLLDQEFQKLAVPIEKMISEIIYRFKFIN